MKADDKQKETDSSLKQLVGMDDSKKLVKDMEKGKQEIDKMKKNVTRKRKKMTKEQIEKDRK